MMGGAAAVPTVIEDKEPPDILYINEKLGGRDKGFGFSRSMFSKREWRTLKIFCLTNRITQIDLNRMYNRYLSSDAAVVRKMRIRLEDISCSFSKQSEVRQDLAEVLCPFIFLKSFEGLKEPYSSTEVSFARCIIMGYVTCLQPISDMIFDFFSISRRSLNAKVNATIFAYNVKECIKVFACELMPSAAKKFIVQYCIGDDDEEWSLLTIMQIGTKYPITFYPLRLFQKCLKRLIFGDRFWDGRNALPSRFDDEGIFCDEALFMNQKCCIKETARQIIGDFTAVNNQPPRLYAERRSDLISISAECCVKIKDALGYRWARALIEESELEYPDDQYFADIPSDVDSEVRIYDSKIQSDFVYNVGTGYRAWIEHHKLKNGEIVKELWHRTASDL